MSATKTLLLDQIQQFDKHRGTKEQLRRLTHATARGGHRHEINARLYAFYTWCAGFAKVPEIVTLAETIETWWNEIEAFCRG